MATPQTHPDIPFEPMELSEAKADTGAIPPSISPPGLIRTKPAYSRIGIGFTDQDFDELLGIYPSLYAPNKCSESNPMDMNSSITWCRRRRI